MILQGVPAGDGECWCFLVDADTFEQVKGRPPEPEDAHADTNRPHVFMLHPDDLLGTEHDGKVVVLSIEIMRRDRL